MIAWKGGENVRTNEVLKRLRVEKQMTQDEMAEKLFVTRQAVSRWETGETTPNVEMRPSQILCKPPKQGVK